MDYINHLNVSLTGYSVRFVNQDWNAKVGSQETPGVIGKFGLEMWNEAGQRLIVSVQYHDKYLYLFTYYF